MILLRQESPLERSQEPIEDVSQYVRVAPSISRPNAGKSAELAIVIVEFFTSVMAIVIGKGTHFPPAPQKERLLPPHSEKLGVSLGGGLMTSSNGILIAIEVLIWVVCILLGMGIGTLVGRFVGMLLGWMVATSLDASIAGGGRLGKQMGKWLGTLAGVGLGSFGAFSVIAFIMQNFSH